MIMNDDGYVKLGYAILEQAVHDVQSLQAAGLVCDGKVKEPWPVRRGKAAKMCGYSKPHEAKELLLWFRNGSAEELLSLLGAPINAEAMCQRLHI